MNSKFASHAFLLLTSRSNFVICLSTLPALNLGDRSQYGQRKWSEDFKKNQKGAKPCLMKLPSSEPTDLYKELAEGMNGLAESKAFNEELPVQVRNLHKGSYRCPATISHYFF